MKNTKDKILEKSKVLFNQYGIASVSQRKISDALKISPGNLTYHFKKRDEIVEALYFQLVEKLSTAIEKVDKEEMNLVKMFYIMDLMMDSFYEYRFFFLDFVHIMRDNKKIRDHYDQLTKMRKLQFEGILNQLIDMGFVRKEEFPHEYENLYTRFHVLIDFWISSAEINHKGVKQKQLEEYKHTIRQTIYPYLTPNGKRIFLSTF